MSNLALYAVFAVTIGVIISAFLCLYRIWKGPTALDRVNALSLIGIDTMLLIVLMGYMAGQLDFYVDMSITYAMTGFITMIVLAKYLISRSLDSKRNIAKERECEND